MSTYVEWPIPYGINLITELAPDNYYQIARSQTAVFPFKMSGYSAVRVDAGHSSFYDNQQGTLSVWASDQVNGRSITGYPNSNLTRIQLQGSGSSWLFHKLGADLSAFQNATITQWINPIQTYYMCFQNLENKDNGLYAKFTYII